MTDEKRAAVAFICGNKFRDYVATRLFDYNRNKYIPYNIQKNMYGFNMFDYDRASYLNGNDNQIFDFATNSYIQIVYNNFSFSGFDYQSGTSFNGIINNDSVSIYDYQSMMYYNYHIQ